MPASSSRVTDDLVNEGGIMDLWVREARLFKYGSGTGSNFSTLRGEGEKLSGGGKSSGLMSFLKIGDRAAGAIKSGGTTRRAAKMVIVDVDHPDIETYIDWKVMEEQKVAALVTGSKINQKHLKAVLKACVNCEGSGDDCFSPEKNPALKREIKLARRSMVPDNLHQARDPVRQAGLQGHQFPDLRHRLGLGSLSHRRRPELEQFGARHRRLPASAVEADGKWDLTYRKNGKVAKTLDARELWEKIGYAAWASADPGLQYHTTVNDWHTCPAGGEIRASNPCSEYMFLDDTACNLASLNLLHLPRREDRPVRRRKLRARGAAVDRGAGNLGDDGAIPLARDRGALLRIPHARPRLRQYRRPADDRPASPTTSHAGRAIAGALTAIMTGVCYATSAEMAEKLGPFPGYEKNRDAHAARDAQSLPRRLWRGRPATSSSRSRRCRSTTLRSTRQRADAQGLRWPPTHAKTAWNKAIKLGEKHGYRNAQATVIAPTGTIGLVMDCDTTGIEPDFALVKFKKLAGGGYFKIINRAVPEALRTLGYREAEIAEIEAYAVGHGSLAQAPAINHTTLKAKGFTDEAIAKVEKALPTAFDIKFVFNKWTLGEEFCRDTLGITAEDLALPTFDLLGRRSASPSARSRPPTSTSAAP